MPWAGTDRMSLRSKFVAACLEYEAGFCDLFQDLCRGLRGHGRFPRPALRSRPSEAPP